ncbi:MAG: hypothetical protein J6Y62_00860 [Clostridia bacterium]|nr:hypothetical protein [Clostridia bacterium]
MPRTSDNDHRVHSLWEGCLGERCAPGQVVDFIMDNLKWNIERSVKKATDRITLNIWGLPGHGKTSIIKQLEGIKVPFPVRKETEFREFKDGKEVVSKGWTTEMTDMPIKIVNVPLGQLEEMGDVLGFPIPVIQFRMEVFPPEYVAAKEKFDTAVQAAMDQISALEKQEDDKDADGKISALAAEINRLNKDWAASEDKRQKQYEEYWVEDKDSIIKAELERGAKLTGKVNTKYAPPSWVPDTPGPGIILFDDGNRASSRIMKGLMQLVQDYETVAWGVPAGYTIVFTGNPDNANNQVTTMDMAQLTRMKHITMTFDEKAWARWAMKEGLAPIGVHYVMEKPTMVEPNDDPACRINPRTVSEFFRVMAKLPPVLKRDSQGRSLNALDETVARKLEIEAKASVGDDWWESFRTYIIQNMDDLIPPEEILNEPDKAIGRLDSAIDAGRNDIVFIACTSFVNEVFKNSYVFQLSHIDAFDKLIDLLHRRMEEMVTEITDSFSTPPQDVKEQRVTFVSRRGKRCENYPKEQMLWNFISGNDVCNNITHVTDDSEFRAAGPQN